VLRARHVVAVWPTERDSVVLVGDTIVMDLPDGRELAWLELGDPKGPPVFVFHGTPGSRLQVSFDERPIVASGVRFIAVDRPGYGHSTFHRGRRLTDWSSDVSFLADHLDIDTFSVIGISGGGPHAAVCARFLSDRVVGAGIVSGVGPLAVPGAEDGMMGFNRVVIRLARISQYLVYPPFALSASIFRSWPELALRAASGQVPASDIEILSRPQVKHAFVEDYRRASSTSALAAAQDFALFAKDWGFHLSDIDVPVNIWHGDHDRNVPISHGRVQAEEIPGARFHECPGQGHMLIIDRVEEILRTVSAYATERQ
jgi:pimeloyl-ACP methyl ester carboxylesterase